MADIDLMKIRQLDGSLLLVLRELLQTRRASVAAQRLGLSQSAISHSLARLRELFDDPLFIREPHGLAPTRHALELAPRVEALLRAMDDALGLSGRFVSAATTRGFRIGAPDHVTTLFAPRLMECFAAQAPRARIAFSQRLGQDASDAVLRDELDVALGRFGRRDERLVIKPLFEDRYGVIARRDHPQLKRGLTAALYARLSQVQVSVAGDFSSPDFGRGGPGLPQPRTVAAVPRFMIAFAVIAGSDAVALAPMRLARRYAAAFGLQLHKLPFDVPPIQVLVLHRPHLDAGLSFLLDQLARVAADSGESARRHSSTRTRVRPSSGTAQ